MMNMSDDELRKRQTQAILSRARQESKNSGEVIAIVANKETQTIRFIQSCNLHKETTPTDMILNYVGGNNFEIRKEVKK